MKITNSPSAKQTGKGKQEKASGAAGKIPRLFDNRLAAEQRSLGALDHEISELQRRIEDAGDKLEKQPTLPNFKQFRELLSILTKKVTTEAYRLEKFGGTPQNPRYFEAVTIIDAELDKLYNLIVSGQKNNMAITASVIGIKGLVVDLIT